MKRKTFYFVHLIYCISSYRTALVPGFFKYRWYRVPGQPGSWRVWPYDFRDAENADGISESSYKNGIYSLAWNVTEFVKVWIN